VGSLLPVKAVGISPLRLEESSLLFVPHSVTSKDDSVTARKDDAPAATQTAIVNVPGMSSIAGGGGVIHTTSG